MENIEKQKENCDDRDNKNGMTLKIKMPTYKIVKIAMLCIFFVKTKILTKRKKYRDLKKKIAMKLKLKLPCYRKKIWHALNK